MGNRIWMTCSRCRRTTSFGLDGGVSENPVCTVCQFLGDRSLVWLLRNPAPERLARFFAAPPSRLREEREGRRGVDGTLDFEGDPRHDDG